jgi:competence protein ComEA
MERVRDLLARAGLAGLSDRAILALALACFLVVAFAAWRFWPAASAGDSAIEVTEATTEVAADAPAAELAGREATATAASVTVHVVGAVHRPGVYALAEGSRVRDALAAAGGCVGDAMLEAVNLARILADGEQVRIPTAEEVAAGAVASAAEGAPTGGAAPPGAAGGKVNINTASATELDTLPGVGPSTAQKIVDDRTANGPFKRIEDLMRVSGIGEKKFEALKDYVSVG